MLRSLPHTRIIVSLFLAAAAACSLIVDFDPEGKPCGNEDGGACLPGYRCNEERLCVKSSSNGGDEDAGPPPMSLDSFCPSLMDALAAKSSACLGGPVVLVREFRYDGNAACRRIAKAVAGGRAVYDPFKAESCLTAIPNLSCADPDLGQPPACQGVLVGTRPTGDYCYDSVECADGVCLISALACPGKCAALVPASGNCSGGKPCVIGATCTGASADAGPTCVALAPDGGACSASAQPGARCLPGLYCDPTANDCVPQLAEDAGCSKAIPGQCSPRLRCMGVDASTGTCSPVKPVGATCTPAGIQPGTVPECEEFAYCQGSCFAWRGLDDTYTCGSQNGELALCSVGWCSTDGGSTSGACQPWKNAGAPCTQDQECGRGGACAMGDAGTRVCFPPCAAP